MKIISTASKSFRSEKLKGIFRLAIVRIFVQSLKHPFVKIVDIRYESCFTDDCLNQRFCADYAHTGHYPRAKKPKPTI